MDQSSLQFHTSHNKVWQETDHVCNVIIMTWYWDLHEHDPPPVSDSPALLPWPDKYHRYPLVSPAHCSPPAALSPEVATSAARPGGGPVQGQGRGGGGGRGPGGGHRPHRQRVGGLVIGVTLGGDHGLSCGLGLDWNRRHWYFCPIIFCCSSSFFIGLIATS